MHFSFPDLGQTGGREKVGEMLLEWRKLSRLQKTMTVGTGGRLQMLYFSTKPQEGYADDEEFPKLDLIKSKEIKRQARKRWERKEVPPPR